MHMQYTIYNIQYTIYNMQYAIYSMCNIGSNYLQTIASIVRIALIVSVNQQHSRFHEHLISGLSLVNQAVYVYVYVKELQCKRIGLLLA